METQAILDILKDRLSMESKAMILALYQSDGSLSKEQMQKRANALYADKNKLDELLIPSRHKLDVHTARIEGAGLVDVEEIGRIRIYRLTSLGKALLEQLIYKGENA